MKKWEVGKLTGKILSRKMGEMIAVGIKILGLENWCEKCQGWKLVRKTRIGKNSTLENRCEKF